MLIIQPPLHDVNSHALLHLIQPTMFLLSLAEVRNQAMKRSEATKSFSTSSVMFLSASCVCVCKRVCVRARSAMHTKSRPPAHARPNILLHPNVGERQQPQEYCKATTTGISAARYYITAAAMFGVYRLHLDSAFRSRHGHAHGASSREETKDWTLYLYV